MCVLGKHMIEDIVNVPGFAQKSAQLFIDNIPEFIKFLDKIYKGNKEHIKKYVIYVNCAHKQGIRFFREELKFFARKP